MNKTKFQLEIITPEEKVFQGKVDMVTAPGTQGTIGILPNHASLMSSLEPGELKVKVGDENIQYMALAGGFLQVQDNKVTILADTAQRAENISEAEAKEAKKRAEKLLDQQLSDVEFTKAEAQLRKALANLKVLSQMKLRRKRGKSN